MRVAIVMRGLLLALLFAPFVTSIAACCGAGCPPRSTQGSGSSGAASSSVAHAARKPRMDLHCTPQTDDEESKCLALGDDRRYGPPLVCRGTPPSPDVVEAEHDAWVQGTEPCSCYTDRDEQLCRSVP